MKPQTNWTEIKPEESSEINQEDSNLTNQNTSEENINLLLDNIEDHFDSMKNRIEKYKILVEKHQDYCRENRIDYNVYTSAIRNAEELLNECRSNFIYDLRSTYYPNNPENKKAIENLLTNTEVQLEKQKLVFENKLDGKSEIDAIKDFTYAFCDFGMKERLDHKLLGLKDNFFLRERHINEIVSEIHSNIDSILASAKQFEELTIENSEEYKSPSQKSIINKTLTYALAEPNKCGHELKGLLDHELKVLKDEGKNYSSSEFKDRLIELRDKTYEKRKLFNETLRKKNDTHSIDSFVNLFEKTRRSALKDKIENTFRELSNNGSNLYYRGENHLNYFRNKESGKKALKLALEKVKTKCQEQFSIFEKVNKDFSDDKKLMEIEHGKHLEHIKSLNQQLLLLEHSKDTLENTLEFIKLDPRGEILILQEEIAISLRQISRLRDYLKSNYDSSNFKEIENRRIVPNIGKYETLANRHFLNIEEKDAKAVIDNLKSIDAEAKDLVQKLESITEEEELIQFKKANEPKLCGNEKIDNLRANAIKKVEELNKEKENIVEICNNEYQNLAPKEYSVNPIEYANNEIDGIFKSLLVEADKSIEKGDFQNAEKNLNLLIDLSIKTTQRLKKMDRISDEKEILRQFCYLTDSGEFSHLEASIMKNVENIKDLAINISNVAVKKILTSANFNLTKKLTLSSSLVITDKVNEIFERNIENITTVFKKDKAKAKTELEKIKKESENLVNELEIIAKTKNTQNFIQSYISLNPISPLIQLKSQIDQSISTMQHFSEIIITCALKTIDENKKLSLAESRKMKLDLSLANNWIEREIDKANELKVPQDVKENRDTRKLLVIKTQLTECEEKLVKLASDLYNINHKRFNEDFFLDLTKLNEKTNFEGIQNCIESNFEQLRKTLKSFNEINIKYSKITNVIEKWIEREEREYNHLINVGNWTIDWEEQAQVANELHVIDEKAEHLVKVLNKNLTTPTNFEEIYDFLIQEGSLTNEFKTEIQNEFLKDNGNTSQTHTLPSDSFAKSLEKWITHNFRDAVTSISNWFNPKEEIEKNLEIEKQSLLENKEQNELYKENLSEEHLERSSEGQEHLTI